MLNLVVRKVMGRLREVKQNSSKCALKR